MRIAWLGPEPSLEGGVPYAAPQISLGLTRQGAEVDAFVAPVRKPNGEHFRNRPGLRIFEARQHWDWNRWYSRDPLVGTATSMLARVRAPKRLVALLLERHVEQPYDIVYQFSQFEVPWLRRHAHRLPLVVVHPEVHAAGELRWHRRERQLALHCGGAWRTEGTTALLAARTFTQKRHARQVCAVVTPSRVFARRLAADYGVAREAALVANPIDTERYRRRDDPKVPRAPVQLLFVSRISVRKTVEMIVALSQRSARDPGAFHIRIVGTGALFSDYRPLLERLSTPVATYDGACSSGDLDGLYRESDIVLQPRQYEPFTLMVGEALASGTPVVVSDEVGAGEGLPHACCSMFRSGDLDDFEARVRLLGAALGDAARGVEIRAAARRQAERRFAPDVVCRALLRVCDTVVQTQRGAA